jgi:hypothetical protein
VITLAMNLRAVLTIHNLHKIIGIPIWKKKGTRKKIVGHNETAEIDTYTVLQTEFVSPRIVRSKTISFIAMS